MTPDRLSTQTRPRVLLADDYAPLLTALARILSFECDIVGYASTVAELLKNTSAYEPDVVVVDLYFTDENGIEACRQIRRLRPDVKIIMITAEDDPCIRSAALSAGASDFVPKCLAHALLLPAVVSCSRSPSDTSRGRRCGLL